MYTGLAITNFRGLKKPELEDFSQFNLFVGKNNSGKTTVLEALFLLSGPYNPQLATLLNVLRGFNTVG